MESIPFCQFQFHLIDSKNKFHQLTINSDYRIDPMPANCGIGVDKQR